MYLSENIIYNQWINIIKNNHPIVLINNNIFNKIKENKSDFIFLTARKKYLKNITIQHLKYCNIDSNKIYFSSQKGNKLLELFSSNEININSYNNIIFVDDLIENIYDVYNKINIYSNSHNIFLYNIPFI